MFQQCYVNLLQRLRSGFIYRRGKVDSKFAEGYTDETEGAQLSYVSNEFFFHSINVRANVSDTKPSLVSVNTRLKD